MIARAWPFKSWAGAAPGFRPAKLADFPIWPLQGFALTVQLGIAKALGRSRSSWGNLMPINEECCQMFSIMFENISAPWIVTPTFTPMPDAYRLETY